MYYIDIQHACTDSIPVGDEDLSSWAQLALSTRLDKAELTLRLVDLKEITELNHRYRKKNKPTNVLAFPATHPENIELDFPLLGDVIVCPAVILEESQIENKPLNEHWAHIIIHGVLHLLGYDHIKEDEALKMQTIEINLLAQLGIKNPYHIEAN